MTNPDMFARGYCAEFALALHDLYGYELVSFDERCDDDFSCSIHYAARVDGMIVDVRGRRSVEDVVQSLWSCEKQRHVTLAEVLVRVVTAHDIESETEIVEEAKALAVQFIEEWCLV